MATLFKTLDKLYLFYAGIISMGAKKMSFMNSQESAGHTPSPYPSFSEGNQS